MNLCPIHKAILKATMPSCGTAKERVRGMHTCVSLGKKRKPTGHVRPKRTLKDNDQMRLGLTRPTTQSARSGRPTAAAAPSIRADSR